MKDRKENTTFQIVGVFGCPIRPVQRKLIERESLGVLGVYDDDPSRGSRLHVFHSAADLGRWSAKCRLRRVCVVTAENFDALPDAAWERAKSDALIVIDSARKRGEAEYLRQVGSRIRASGAPRGRKPNISRRRKQVEFFKEWLDKEKGNLKNHCEGSPADYEKQVRAMSARCLELFQAVYVLWDDSGRPAINDALLESPSAFDRNLVRKFEVMGFVFPGDLKALRQAVELSSLKNPS